MQSVSDRLRPFGKTFIYSVVDKVGFIAALVLKR
jgi:hypothetical protein